VLNTQSNDLAVVDAAKQSLVTVVPLGQAPRAIAMKLFESPLDNSSQLER